MSHLSAGQRQSRPTLAVLIPCYQEEAAIGTVVRDFRAALPEAEIYVYDNNSRDKTMRVAAEAGAIVRSEFQQGKGNVVRRMFADIEADVYVMVDGDDTYDAASAPRLVDALLASGLDMVNASRIPERDLITRPGHRFGNEIFTKLVAAIFGAGTSDMLSGYRVFSRRFVKTFPAFSRRFEIETELTVHALEMRMPFGEVPTPYRARALGTESKLSTFKDGFRILWTIAALVKDERPLLTFGAGAASLALLSVVLAIPVLETYAATGLVPRFPTAILSSALMILAFLSLSCGFILSAVQRGRREVKRLKYLELPSVEFLQAAPTSRSADG
jgi:glycosyltransferase involved in cell wall biosynthesis